MKKVILKEKIEEVYLSDLNEDSVVGVQWIDDVKSSFVYNKCQEEYTQIANDRSNTISMNGKKTIKEYIEYIGTKHIKVYLFETQKELFKWLSE